MAVFTGRVIRLLLLRKYLPVFWWWVELSWDRTLICIPVGGELLPTIGGEGFVAFFGGILVLSLMSFLMARWACLDYKWKWSAKI